MLVMVEEGRLGNQLFQYAALRSEARPSEKLVLFGFDQLKETFDGIDARFIHIASNPLKHLVSLDYSRVGRLAARIPGLSSVTESVEARPIRGAGSIGIVHPSWFQSPAYLLSSTISSLEIKPRLKTAAREILDSLNPNGAPCAFVHVRAGDYRTWPSTEAPAILPPRWYAEQAAALSVRVPGVRFIGVGDEPEYVEEVMSAIPNSRSARAGYGEEFALMTLCRHGILSASSFAYWAAWFARRESPSGLFIAPTFWAGHASGDWYPTSIASDFMTFEPVKE